MARIPTFDQLGQTPAPQPAGAVVAYNPNSGAEEAPGQAMARAGAGLETEADKLHHIIRQEQEKTDSIMVEDAWNQYKSHAIDLMHGPNGLLNTEGADAVRGDLIGRAQASLESQRAKILGGLGNDEQRGRFMQRADITDMHTKQSTYAHLAKETKQYDKIVMDGSASASRAKVASDPMSESVFIGEKDTLMRQAEEYLNRNGIQDKGTREDLRSKLTDSLYATRIEAMLSMNQPLAAEQLFKQVSGDIKNPETRMTFRNRVRAAAIPANASIDATNTFDEAIAKDNERRAAAPRTTIEAGPTKPGALFDTVVGSLLKREGGYVASDGKSKAPANFGINQKYNPDVDVKNLTRAGAVDIYRERYWNAINGDSLAPATALVALDTAALQGPEVAKKLIVETGGDPQAMIARRREQLTAIARRDPEQAPNLAGWLKRMDGLAAEAATMPDDRTMRTVAMTNDPITQDTSANLPHSRDISALLPVMMARVESLADERYGKDRTNPDRIAYVKQLGAEIHSRVTDTVQQFNSIQKQVQGEFIDLATGIRTGTVPRGTRVAGGQQGGMLTVAQIQADPQLRQKWDMLDPAAKPHILNLMDKASKEPKPGDPILYRQMYDRINLPEGDPKKILFPSQILDERLSIPQIDHLNSTLKQWTTPGGRSFNQLRTTMDAYVARQMRENLLFTAQPAKATEAAMRWSLDAGKKIDEYAEQNKDPRTLFMMDTKDSIVTPAYLATYVNTTPGQGLAAGAAGVASGAQRPIGEPPPARPKTEAERDALAPGTKYIDPAGNLRRRENPRGEKKPPVDTGQILDQTSPAQAPGEATRP